MTSLAWVMDVLTSTRASRRVSAGAASTPAAAWTPTSTAPVSTSQALPLAFSAARCQVCALNSVTFMALSTSIRAFCRQKTLVALASQCKLCMVLCILGQWLGNCVWSYVSWGSGLETVWSYVSWGSGLETVWSYVSWGSGMETVYGPMYPGAVAWKLCMVLCILGQWLGNCVYGKYQYFMILDNTYIINM